MILQEGQQLPNGWRLESLRPDGATVTRGSTPEWREALRKAAVLLVPLVFLVVLRAGLSGSQAPVVWPLVVALLLVCVACIAAVARHLRRAIVGVRLHTAGTAVNGWVEGRGLLSGYLAGQVNQQATQIRVQQFAAEQTPGATRLRLTALLADGREVGGPEWVCGDDVLPTQLRLAVSLAEALGRGGISVASQPAGFR